MFQVLRQAWWAPIAGLLAVIQLVFAPVALVGDEDAESRVVSFLIFLVGGAITAAGLILRTDRRVPGNVVLLAGCACAAFWFWTLVLPVGALVVAAGVLTSGWQPERRLNAP